MNTTWIIQCVLGVIFMASGLTIMILPKEKLATRLSWVKNYSIGMVYFICIAKIAGGIGLILPMYLDILPILTPVAALGIATIMALAIEYHIRHKEFKDLPAPIIFLALSLFVAYNRF